MFIGIPNGSLFCGIGSKAKDFADRKSGQKTAKKAKKHIAGKNWKEYDRYRRKNRKEALTFQQKHVEFRDPLTNAKKLPKPAVVPAE